MASRELLESARLMATLDAAHRRGRLLHVRSVIRVHERAEVEGEPCPCCGSRTARVVEERPDLELLIDRLSGARRLRCEARDVAEWDRRAAKAELVIIPFSVTRSQLPALLDGAGRKVILASGGARSGKSHLAVLWLVRRWLLRGRRRARFWLVGPSHAQAWDLLVKLLDGEAAPVTPPVLPRDREGRQVLAVRWPSSQRASELCIHMIDGSKIELRHGHSTHGANLKGANVVDMVIDEAAEVEHRETWHVLIGRLAGADGCAFAATTPRAGHYLKEIIVDQAERVEEDGRKVGSPLFVNYPQRKADNVWYTTEAIRKDRETYKDEGARRRECDGEWIEEGQGVLYLEFERARHVTYDPLWNLADLGVGERDVTPAAVGRLFPGDSPYVVGRRPGTTRYIGGSDVNVTPFVTVIGQVEALDKDDPHNPAKWRLWVWDEVVSRQSTSVRQAELVQSDARARDIMGLARSPYRGLPVVIDPSACYSDPTRKRLARAGVNSRSNCAAGAMTEAGLDVRACNLSEDHQPYAPRIRDRVNLLHDLMRTDRLRVHNRCTEVLRSLSTQQNDGTGRAVKEPGEASDRLSAAADALGYLSWALFAYKPRARGRWVSGPLAS